MVTQVIPISKTELQGLVSSGSCGHISIEDQDILSNCLGMTTSLWIGKVDEDILCVFGVVPQTLSTNSAYLWLWTTDRIGDHEFIFVRRSQLVIQALLERFDYLYGVCEVNAEQSKRWLKWLGAEFGFPRSGYVPFRIEGK